MTRKLFYPESVMNRVHFYNIANEAGVSVRTLYRVMNNRGAVSTATRRQVEAALNRYGYLCAGKKESQTILFDIIQNPFIERVGILLMQRLSLRDFRCMLSNHLDRKERFLDAAVQADIVVMCSFPSEELLREVRQANSECLIVNLFGGNGGDVAIDSDDCLGGQLAARHFLRNGHRHVGVFTTLDQSNHEERYKGFFAEMMYHDPGCKVELHRFFQHTRAEEFWEDYFRKNKDSLPTGFFCPLGGNADYLPEYAAKYGLKIPEHFSLIGYNRPEERNFHRPLHSYDTVAFDIEQLAAWGEYYILNRPMLKNRAEIHTLLRPQLEIHGSVRNIAINN